MRSLLAGLPPAPVLHAIGNTPLLPLPFAAEGITLHAKAELLNPSGSIKDPLTLTILCDRAERYYSTRLFSAATNPMVSEVKSSSPTLSS